MTAASHQTVRLARGKHISPEHGTCVMELASMLSGGAFTDHPRCACPIIGAFLRSYNDWVDDRRRQDLYAYASEVVGSRASSGVQEARAQRLMEWAEDLERRRLKRLWFGSHRWTKLLGPDPADIASRVVCAIARQKDHPHQEVLAMLDELLAMGRSRERRPDLSTIDDYLARLSSSAPDTSAIAAPSKAPAITSPG
jgi:hypothetical protein